ncbi:Glutamyl-tRNA(Gln) amidotransferase subunit C, chloroplastic/mitochondrial [Sesamum angolense]|uniref:Glutamyl-tRNA(Gln) amidotransferase subunit C, chloroplastic/mitochondrial n=1 Tax=Sesamum angolense TaxID=2727404 RepID=A0AAE1W8L2_9LAMI|nr:Glutamyl-tRNA(Gln) amidotransferase subunit C, chloroplastic/mitochondrial [Sesamum angolense]
MASKAAQLLLRATPPLPPSLLFSSRRRAFPRAELVNKRLYAGKSSLEPPDVGRLAETTRISLTSQQVEEFAPKIRQMIDWFGQLQAVDLQSIEPAIRADTEGDNLRDDIPEICHNRDAIIAAVPSYDEPYSFDMNSLSVMLQTHGIAAVCCLQF